MRNKPAIEIDDDARKRAVTALREYFAGNMDEEIGDLKAALLLDYVLSELGPTIYNQAIADAQKFFEERTSDLSGVFYQTEFPITARRSSK